MDLLVDTNVFLEFLLKREHFDSVNSFFRLCNLKHHRIFITSMSFRDIEYFVHKTFHDNKASRLITHKAYEMCTKVIPISADSAINALFSSSKDMEDSLIAEAAKEAMLDGIVTFNVKDFTSSGISAFTPEQMLSYL